MKNHAVCFQVRRARDAAARSEAARGQVPVRVRRVGPQLRVVSQPTTAAIVKAYESLAAAIGWPLPKGTDRSR